jgi:Fe(3+) dicitrate transport protein
MKFFTFLTIMFLISTITVLSFSDQKKEEISQNINENINAADSLSRIYDFPQIDVIGRRPNLINSVPGSADIISEQTLNRVQPLTSNEILRRVTGVHVVDEEGLGLRSNIGIRGLDPDRSRTVLMMEDGVPIALAPYGEPEMYYSPSIDRMKNIEILKGSGSILFGPQTIGGVINYITADPPLDSKTNLSVRGGEYGLFTGQGSYGTTVGGIGLNANFLHRRADNLGTTTFHTNDFTAKLKFNLSSNSRLGIKFAAYDEVSNSTYIGLTETMYDAGDYYTVIAPNDKLNVDRYSVSLTHDYFFSNTAYIRTTAFGYKTSRNWLRQDFSRSSTASNLSGVVFGDASVAGGAIYMRNSTGSRDRQFEVAGIEPRLVYSYTIGKAKNEFEGGARFLYERAFEQMLIGNVNDPTATRNRDDEIRTGYAYSVFAQNRTYFTEQLSITPGVRIESFDYERDINRRGYADTSITNKSDIFSVIPGLGFNYNFNNQYTLFAGVHRGFAPPRIKDAITSSGEALELEAELSWNYEIGLRANLSSILAVELTGYMLDFSNQIIPVSQSSGGAGTGLVNGGETLHQGVEAGFKLDIGRALDSKFGLIFGTSATFSKSVYGADRFITSNSSTVNIKDNELPYAPKFFLSNSLEMNTLFGFGLVVSGTYVGQQFTDELNSIEAAADGQSGKMPAYFVLDLTGSFNISSMNSTLFVSVKNLLDERYIASRRPQGIKVGLPRIITAGVDVSL